MLISMSNDGTDHYEGALLEEIRDNVKLLAEGMSGLKNTVKSVNNRLTQVEQHTELIPAIKAAVTDQGQETEKVKSRVAVLERAVS